MIKQCQRCQQDFRVPPCRAESAHFCSQACRRNRVSRTCAVCGSVYTGQPQRRGAICCSKQCAGVLRRRRIAKPCEGCGQIMDLPLAFAKRRYCSRACRHDATYVVYRCEMCGTEREAHRSEQAMRFCGDACRLKWFTTAFVGEASPQWQGGAVGYYGPSWRRARRAIRERDPACCHCGAEPIKEALSVAHIIPFRWYDIERHEEANRIENLLGLCRSCHRRFDQSAAVRARLDELLALEDRQLELGASA